MKILRKLLSLVVSSALLITTIPINSFSATYPVLPQYEFSNFAKITSANFYNSDTTVINIQDLHNNKEVQDNIYKLLDSLNKKYENLEVYIEGADDVIDYGKLSKEMNEKEMSALMNSLYDDDKLSGAEFFGYKNNKILNPTEQKNIYAQNIQNYSFLIKNKQHIKDLLFARYAKIKTLDKYLNAEQRKLLKFYNAYLNKRISSEKFYSKVFRELNERKISSLEYINTKLYVDVMNASKRINQKAAQRQLQTLLAQLKNTITYQEYVNLVKDSNNLTDINIIFAYLSANIDNNDKISKYPDLFNLISLREISSLINPLDLIEEERQMMEDVLLSYSRYSQNKEIVFLNLFFQTYKKLLFAEISSSEYKYYKQNYSEFLKIYKKYLSNDLFELYGYSRVAEQFNELNLQRNLSFVKNISSNITIDKNYKNYFRGKLFNIDKILSSLGKAKSVKVIVSGGFHTEGINELLDENKISNITLTPNVKENDSLYEQKYLDSIIEQADIETNAIAKRPFLQQNSQIIIDNIVGSLDSILKYLKEGKTLEEIKNIINGVIEANSLKGVVTFDMSDDGIATIEVDGKIYTLNYEKGKIVVQNNFSTTLAKNIKALIREALKVGSIRSILGLKSEYDGTPGSEFNQEAEYFFMKHNILFPGFADICLRAIVGDLDPDVSDRSQDKVYQALLKAKNGFRGKEFNCDITVGRSTTLVGARPDGYGNTEEYGSLFYVVWEQTKSGVYVAKNILVSSILLDALQNSNEQDLKKFFTSLFVHERLEMIAITGRSEKFNQYVLERKLSRTTEVFHQYIQSSDFSSFLAEQGMSSENIDEQKALLKEMDIIISDVNRANSQYSDIISVSSLEGNKKSYTEDTLDAFLSVRSGEEETITDYNTQLLNKIVSQIKKEYILSKKLNNPDFDIEKNLDIEDFIGFINKFVVVYRKSNNYISSDSLAAAIKKALTEEFNFSDKQAEKTFIASVELEEDKKGEIILKDSKEIKGKKVLFIEDIISKQSETFNDIYNLLMENGADKVQGAVFFDLSKEPENSNLITDSVLERIIETQDGSQLLDIITSVDGKISKYLAYWLVKLSQDSKGQEILRQINSLDSRIVNNVMDSLINMVKTDKLAKRVKCYEVIDLVLFLGFDKTKDINSVTKQDIDELLEKYDFRVKDKKGNLALEVDYDDWKESIPSLIVYAYMLGYDYIDALQINNLMKKYGKNEIPNKELIDTFCKEFNISFTDKKTKLRHTYEKKIPKELNEEIETQKNKLKEAGATFKEKAKEAEREYERTRNYDKYLEQMDKISAEYRDAVKAIMISAKQMVVDNLAERNMKIDDSLFAIIIGGSLVKGNMMVESDIYYDIIVPDNIISQSIDNHFAPLYSSVLQEIGLTNYYVLKYSTTDMTRRDSSFDERDIAQFLNYSPLSPEESKKKLFVEYRKSQIEEIKSKDTKSKMQQNLALVTEKYFAISQKGKNWLGNSFHIAYDGNKTFSARWTIMAFESKLNEIIFKYILESGDENISVPVSVKDQIEFIKEHNIINKTTMDKLEFYWKYLSAGRYIKQSNTWTDISDKEKEAINEINKFVLDFSVSDSMPEKVITKIERTEDLLSVIEDFVNDNSTGIGDRRDYNKYSHLETWKNLTDEKNKDIFVKAQVIFLLLEMGDIEEVEQKLKELEIQGLDEYLPSIINSLKAIKLIDEKFPDYSSIQGERSMQNYWDAVATTVQNPETMFALIAHKLTKAQTSQNKEDQLLLYSVYLPLSKRFGNSDIYEYVRNVSFECSHPAEYLNLLNIINTLYGIPYSKLKEYNGNLRQALIEYFEANDMDMSKIEIKNRVKTLYSIYEKLNSSRRKDDNKEETLSDLDIAAMKFIVNSDDIFNRLMTKKVRTEKFDNMSAKVIKKKILGYIDRGFKDLDDKEKEFLFTMFAEMKNAVFADYKLVDTIKDNLKDIIAESKDPNNGLVDIKTLREKLEAEGDKKALELWFVNFFEGGLKDLIGLHVIVKDEDFQDAVRVIETKTGKNAYSGVTDFFLKKIKILFSKFNKDNKNKQARLKINAAIKSAEGVPIPVEMCLYERTDYENETYGLYNHKKMSAPHYIYKLGKNFNASLFEHIFAKELDYSFIDPDDKETKQMVYESDGIIPTEDLSVNFSEIMKKISGSITCFVEYEDGVYVQKLPKGSTVFDLATSRSFSDDVNVAVYRNNGDQITSEVSLDDTQTYKVIKREGCFISVPRDGADIHTKRAKLIYSRLNNQNKANISGFIKSIGTIADINEVLNLLLKDEKFRKILDNRDLEPSNIAEKLLNTESNNKILQDEKLLKELLLIIFDIILDRDLENMLPSQFIERSNQIANHYNLANMFELFEAIENGIIDYDDIKSFYEMCFVVKTKADISIEDIEDKVRAKYKITKLGSKDLGYNLMINDDKYFVEGLPLIDDDSIQAFIDLLDFEDGVLKTEHVVDIDEKRVKTEKNTIFVSTGFAQPKKEFSLMSLGNNIETLVRYAMVHHSRLVRSILEGTKSFAKKYENTPKTEEAMTSLSNEERGLMAQILMGFFSGDSYNAQDLLYQGTPYLTQEDVSVITDIQNLDFSEYAELIKEYGIDLNKVISKYADISVKTSRSFDLHIESEDVFSFATIGIDSNGMLTLYVSEVLLRELSKKDEKERQYLLRQLILHEIIEREILLSMGETDSDSEEAGTAGGYEKVHELFEKYEGQINLMNFVKETVVPNALQKKEALFGEMDALFEQSDSAETDSKTAIALMFGNLNIDSFINTYKAYRDKKVGRIFISGNTRGSLGILKILRDIKKHPEYGPLMSGIIEGGNASSVRTVKDLLSLPETEFNKLKNEDLAALPKRSSEVFYLDETLTTPISKDEIFDLVAKDGVTEAAIIKWVMLESARQDDLTRKQINNLIRSMSLETDAANTLQNIENIFAQREFIDFVSGKDNIDIVVIQNPFSQLRAKSTLNKYLISNRGNPVIGSIKFTTHTMKFGRDALDYYTTSEKLMKSLGEWTRIIAYTLKGDIIPVLDNKEGLDAIPLEVFAKNVLPLIAILNDKEKEELKNVFVGFLYDRNTGEIKDEFLQKLSEAEKKELEKIKHGDLNDKDKKNETSKIVLRALLTKYYNENKLGQNKYNLIGQFMEYLCSDTTGQRDLEQEWTTNVSAIVSEDILPDLPIEEKVAVDRSFEEKLQNTRDILSAA